MSIQVYDDEIIYADRNDSDTVPMLENASHDRIGIKGTSWYFAVFLVVNAALGAGLLNFPNAYDRAGGIGVAVAVQGVLIAFVIAALLILASCSDVNESETYQDVVLEICGKRAQQLCAIAVALYCYGTCITFLIIIGDQSDRIFASLHGDDFCHHWFMHRDFTVALSSSLFILPMCFPRRIDFLKYASSLGVVAILYVVFLITYEFYKYTGTPGTIKVKPDKWMDVFNVVPVICFGYQCHISVVPIYACMEKRSIGNFARTISCAIIICMLTYTMAGAFGYLTFGSFVPSDILEAYNAKDPIVLIGIIMLAVKIITTYPILQFCGRAAIEDLITNFLSELDILRGEKKRRIITSVVWFVTTLGITIVVPDITVVINLLGSLAALFIFVFPGVCWIKATFTKDPNLVLRKDRLIILAGSVFILIGMFLFGVVFAQSIQNDVLGIDTQPKITLCR